MAYLDKLVKQERTGSGITGINVDTSVPNMINPVNVTGNPVRVTGTMPTYKIEIFDTIEKYAQEADKAKIANAKVKLSLDLEQARLDLEEKWSTVNDRFTNEDRYSEFLQAKKDLLSEQEKIISSFKYMNKDEKVLALEKNKINYREDYIKTQGTRNSIYTQQQIDNADANIKQLISLSSNLGIHDDKKAKEYLKMIADTVAIKKELAGLTDDQAIVMIANYTKNAEMERFQNHLEEIKMSDMSYQQKELKLKQIKQAISNKDLMRANIKEIVEMFPVENKDQAEEYLLTEMTDLTSKMVNGYYSEMRAINRAEKKAAAERQRYEKQQQDMYRIANEKTYEDDLYNRNALAVASYQDSKKGYRNLSLNEFLTNPTHLERVSQYGWDVYGNTRNSETLKIVPDSAIKSLKEEVFNNEANGLSDSETYRPIYDLADEISQGNPMIRNNILKDIGLRMKIDPTIIINGESKPEYYKVAKTMNSGQTFLNEMELSDSQLEKVYKNKNFQKLSSEFSNDKDLGNHLALQYLTGNLKKIKNTKELANDFDRIAVNYLKRNDFNTNNVAIAKEFTSNRKNYNYSKLKDVRKKEETKQVKTPAKSEILTNQSSAFGG